VECRPAARAGRRPPRAHGGWVPQAQNLDSARPDRTPDRPGAGPPGTGARRRRQIPQVTGHPERRRFGLLVDLLVHEVAKAAACPPRVRWPVSSWGALARRHPACCRARCPAASAGPFARLHRQDRCGLKPARAGVSLAQRDLPFNPDDQQRCLTPSTGRHQAFGPDHSQA